MPAIPAAPLLLLLNLLLATLSLAALNGPCSSSSGSGTCKVASTCTTGFTVTGACPNDPANVKCCIQKTCKSNAGKCFDKTLNPCSGGHYEAGFCPGDANVQCCIPGVGTGGGACSSSAGSGVCKVKSSCTSGFTVTGACPNDPADVLCCISTTCKSGAGKCYDKTTNSCSGGHYEAGFCPGGTNVQCCLPGASGGSGGGACTAPEGKGVCKQKSSCSTGFTVVGACPNDPADVQCCIEKTCKWNTGRCLNKSRDPCAGGHYEAGLCPGSSDVQCCINTGCPTYWLIGARGSLESLTSWNDFGVTLDSYAQKASETLGFANAEYWSLPYPASAPYDITVYSNSVEAGWQALETSLTRRVAECPSIRIGLLGYSQGAHVVNEALHYLSLANPGVLNNVKSVVLLADPRQDSAAPYHHAITWPDGDRATAPQHDGLLSPQRLPATFGPGRAATICISKDSVCDAPDKGSQLLGQAMNIIYHLAYGDDTAIGYLWSGVLGSFLANTMMA